MDYLRRELDKYRGPQRTFLIEDGKRYKLPPQDELAIAKFAHTLECARADYYREARPEPIELYKAMCKAKDREAVVRMLFPAWSPDAIQHQFCPYNLWTLVEEGRLEHQNFTDSEETEPVPPVTEMADA